MNWQILILGQAFLVSLSLLAMRAIAKQKIAVNGALAVNAAMTSCIYLTRLLVAPFMPAPDSSVFIHYLPWFIYGGLAFTLTNYFGYKVLTHLDAGITGILGTLGTLFTIILAALVLHEDLNSSQAIGAFVLLSSICYVLAIARQPGKHRKQTKSWLIGLCFAIGSSIFFSTAVVNEKFLLSKMSVSTYLEYGWIWQVIIAIGAALIFQRKQLKLLLKPSIMKLAFVGGMLRGISGFLFVYAQIKSNNVALVTIVGNFKLIFITLLGAWLLNERQKLLEKLTASFLALAGLAIIFWK